ncbi:MAG: hypothetical protein U1B94_09595, partial [candidate division NC10 bacterium]|nr:hypothetical protein [candidate division NC10 bacterium]
PYALLTKWNIPPTSGTALPRPRKSGTRSERPKVLVPWRDPDQRVAPGRAPHRPERKGPIGEWVTRGRWGCRTTGPVDPEAGGLE